MKVYTGGTFDMFHVGHLNLLARCREIAGASGEVVVALNGDQFIDKYKGQKPIIPFNDRKRIVEACRYVDLVVENFGQSDSKATIMAVGNVDVLAIGSDWARKDYYKQMQFDQDWLDSQGICLTYIPYTFGISSTQLKLLNAHPRINKP